MKITLTYAARVESFGDDPAWRKDLPPYFDVTEVHIADYLDPEIGDLGVIGGDIRIFLTDGEPRIEVSYWCPFHPSEELIEALVDDMSAQFSDGAGEGGFTYRLDSREWCVTHDGPPEVRVFDDGRNIPGPPWIAIAAENGDLARLNTLLVEFPEDINRMHQGFSALRLAISSGQVQAIEALLAHGADANQLDLSGDSPLQGCAMSNKLSDAESRDVALMLLKAGADPTHRSPNGWTAKDYAENRDKTLTAAVL